MASSFSRQPSQHSWLPFRPTDRQTNRPEVLNEPLISRQRRLFAIERHCQSWIIAPTGVCMSFEFGRQWLYGSSNKASLMTDMGRRVIRNMGLSSWCHKGKVQVESASHFSLKDKKNRNSHKSIEDSVIYFHSAHSNLNICGLFLKFWPLMLFVYKIMHKTALQITKLNIRH